MSNIDTVVPKLSVVLDQPVHKVPNHKMVPIHAALKYSDEESGIQSVILESITSNEPDSGLENGDQPIDIQNADFGTEDTFFNLRSELSGAGTGRVYNITYLVTVKAGNSTSTTQSDMATVLHDSGKN